jgi:hypothetical protein
MRMELQFYPEKLVHLVGFIIRKSISTPLLPLLAFMVCTRANVSFIGSYSLHFLTLYNFICLHVFE